jgi:hypothetical protein
MANKYQRFEFRQYESEVPGIFFLDQETGEIYEFYKDYSKSVPKFNTRRIANLERGKDEN